MRGVGGDDLPQIGGNPRENAFLKIFTCLLYFCIGICVWCVSVWCMCMYGYGCTCVCAGQRKSILLYHALSCSSEEGSLPDPGARLSVSPTHVSAFLGAGVMGTCVSILDFYACSGIQTPVLNACTASVFNHSAISLAKALACF